MDFEVVWNGAMTREGSHTKGELLDPRESSSSLHALALDTLDGLGLTQAELDAAVERLNRSLSKPLDLSKGGLRHRPIVIGRAA